MTIQQAQASYNAAWERHFTLICNQGLATTRAAVAAYRAARASAKAELDAADAAFRAMLKAERLAA